RPLAPQRRHRGRGGHLGRCGSRTRSMTPKKVNLAAAFATFSDHWHPRIAGDVNDFQVKVVKLKGEFVWHHHDVEDELFLVTKGRLTMRFRDGDVAVDAGELIIVPHGVEHLPVADEECELLLLEPKTTVNTGNVGGERTRTELTRL